MPSGQLLTNLLFLLIVTQAESYFQWKFVEEKPTPAPVQLPAPNNQVVLDEEMKLYQELMDTIRALENEGFLNFIKNRAARDIRKRELPLACGKKMINVITSLCLEGCDDKVGYTEEMVVKRCCPTSYRHDIARPFVF
uniref:Uncharacterized protein n=1 Tax=Caenorhabditis tropicalis TaxID=1561998 RepID=A0A1I7T6W9_9PELO